MNKKQGFFITLEGGEGSGKSTLAAQLADYLFNQGYQVVKTREPGGSSLGDLIRQILLNQNAAISISSKAELMLFLAARAQHIEELIKPALYSGKIVICDRFNDSTIAYQGVARRMDTQEVDTLCRLVCGTIQPDLTLFLDVDPIVGLLRTKQLSKEHATEGQFDRIESETIDFHENVRQAFLEIASQDPERVRILNANKPQIDVFKQAIEIVDDLIR